MKITFPRIVGRIVVIGLCVLSGSGAVAQTAATDEAYEREYRFGEAMGLLRSSDEADWGKAVQQLKKLAVEGHERSQYWLGQLYLQGMGVTANMEQGKRWIERASEGGYPIATLALAELELGGEEADDEPNYERTRSLLEEVTSPDSAQRVAPEEFRLYRDAKSRAGYLLGVLYQNGWGVERNVGKAIEHFLDASRTGDKDASMALAIAYAKGEDVERDVAKAKEYFELFDLQSTDELNRSIEQAYGDSGDESDEQNLVEASRYVGEAVSNMVYAMQTEFAREVLDESSEDFDATFAATLLKLAADGGYAEAKVWLGLLHHRGLGVERNLEKAAKLFADAAAEHLVVAMYNLASMIRAGECAAPEGTTEAGLFRSAAERGLFAAQLALDGKENLGPLSPKEALDLCEKRAEAGDARAIYSLAVRKTEGWGVEPEAA